MSPRNSPRDRETQRLVNRARSLADQVFVPRHRARFEQLLAAERERDTEASRDLTRSRALTALRRENRYEWAQTRRRALAIVRAEAGWVDGTLGKAPALQVVCPRCQAPVGRKCRTPGGNPTDAHAARVAASQAAA